MLLHRFFFNESMSHLYISGGTFKKRKIFFDGSLGIRPTPSSIRATLFSWLNNNLSGYSCLEPFAGSGILSWESLSWGADKVCLIEKRKQIYHTLCHQAKTMMSGLRHKEVRLIHKDALMFLKRGSLLDKVDIIFLDPPYHTHLLIESLKSLISLYREGTFLTKETLIYYETDLKNIKKINLMEEFTSYKSRKRGQIYFGLLNFQ